MTKRSKAALAADRHYQVEYAGPGLVTGDSFTAFQARYLQNNIAHREHFIAGYEAALADDSARCQTCDGLIVPCPICYKAPPTQDECITCQLAKERNRVSAVSVSCAKHAQDTPIVGVATGDLGPCFLHPNGPKDDCLSCKHMKGGPSFICPHEKMQTQNVCVHSPIQGRHYRYCSICNEMLGDAQQGVATDD